MLPLLAGQMIGAAASAIPAIVGGINQLTEAKKQKQRAEEIAKQAENVKKRAPQNEFLAALKQKELDALAGMPGYNEARQDIEAQNANVLRQIKETGGASGATAAGAIARVLENQRAVKDLNISQGQFKASARQAATAGMQELGNIQEGLEQEKRAEQAKLRAASEALLQASTANKQTGIETIGGSLAPFGKYIGMAASGGMDNATYNTMTATPQSKGLAQSDAFMNLATNFSNLDEKQIQALMALLTPEQRSALEKIGK